MRSDDRINVLQFFDVILKFLGGNRIFQAFHDFQRAVKFRAPTAASADCLARRIAACELADQFNLPLHESQVVGRVHIVRVQLHRVRVTLHGGRPGFRHRAQAVGVRIEFQFALPVLRVAQIVKRLLLQLQIRRQRHPIENPSTPRQNSSRDTPPRPR